jgi:hypothetical protein
MWVSITCPRPSVSVYVCCLVLCVKLWDVKSRVWNSQLMFWNFKNFCVESKESACVQYMPRIHFSKFVFITQKFPKGFCDSMDKLWKTKFVPSAAEMPGSSYQRHCETFGSGKYRVRRCKCFEKGAMRIGEWVPKLHRSLLPSLWCSS